MPTCYRHPGRETYIRCQRCDRSICPDCMRDAAVGYQCPECVAQGAKQTRSGRTAYGGVRSGDPRLTSYVLIAVNLVVFGLINATGRYSSRLFDLFALSPSGRCVAGEGYYPRVGSESVCSTVGGATWVPGVSDGAPWQVVTSVFTHVEIWHVLANMLGLFMLGPLLENVTGRARFLAVYLLSGLTGSAVVLLLSDGAGATVGASGALYGLMGALLVIAWRHQGNVQVILANLGINVFVTFAIPNISWQGHLGGFLGGCAVAAILVLAPQGPRRTLWQATGMAAFGVLLLLAVLGWLATV